VGVGPAGVPLRAHHLLCLTGFRGLGYSEAFRVAVADLVRDLHRHPLRLSDSADAACRSCPRLTGSGCENEPVVREMDGWVLRLLRRAPGDGDFAGVLYAELGRALAEPERKRLCRNCPWEVFGFCREGLARLRAGQGPPAAELRLGQKDPAVL